MAAVVFSKIFIVPVRQAAAKDKYEVPPRVKVYYNDYNKKTVWEYESEYKYKYKFKYDGSKAKDKKAYMAVFNWFEPVGAFRDTVPIAPPLW